MQEKRRFVEIYFLNCEKFYGAGKAVPGNGFFLRCGRADVLLKSLGILKAAFTSIFIINQVAFAVNRKAFFMGGAR